MIKDDRSSCGRHGGMHGWYQSINQSHHISWHSLFTYCEDRSRVGSRQHEVSRVGSRVGKYLAYPTTAAAGVSFLHCLVHGKEVPRID